MNLEDLKLRLKSIEMQLQQTLANYNMLEGGKAELLHWIEQIESNQQNTGVLINDPGQ